MNPVPFKYTNVRQENEFWCWAAVASNAYNSFLPAVPISQCDAAQSVGQSVESPTAFALSNTLNALGIWESGNDQTPQFYQTVVNELTGAGNGFAAPVCAEVDFGDEDSDADDFIVHFVAITGVDTVNRMVWVADPFFGGDPVEFPFDDFVSNYQFDDHDDGVVSVIQSVFDKFRLKQG
jgi:hypothetical protein